MSLEGLPTPRAVVFDVDGTLVDSERDGHRVAFNQAFEAEGLPYRWTVAEYGRLLKISGGRQRIAAFLESRCHPSTESAPLAARLHRDKTARFTRLVDDGAVQARTGVHDLLRELALESIDVAVATTGTRDWVDPLLCRAFASTPFDPVVTGSEVRRLKPAPDVYVEVLTRLGVAAGNVVAVEDSENGLRAALGAGLRCVVVTNDYTRGQDFDGALAVYPDFGELLVDWRRRRTVPVSR